MSTLFISHSSRDSGWAVHIYELLRDCGYNSVFLDIHPDNGLHVGAQWEQALWRHLKRSRGVVVLCTPHWLSSPWCVAEAMIARERGKPLFVLVQAVGGGADGVAGGERLEVPAFLRDTMFLPVDTLNDQEILSRLLTGLRSEGLGTANDFELPERPYPGLSPFTERDAAVFFGRDEDIDRIRDLLKRCHRHNAKPFVLLLGASGSGKSSLVRAGVVPRLRSQSSGPTADWIILDRVVASDGLVGLARSLTAGFRTAGRQVEFEAVLSALTANGEHSGHVLRRFAHDLVLAWNAPDAKVLLVLDQLEEVFGPHEPSSARALLRLLLAITSTAGTPLVIIATMRSDFLDAFQVFPEAADNYAEVTLDPMPVSRFGEIIFKPAERFGLRLEAGLVERLIAETTYDDALPLLSFTLEKLADACRDTGELTISAYQRLFPSVSIREGDVTLEIRGVAASIKHVADAVLSEEGYAALPPDDPRMRDLRRACFALAQVGDRGQFTRRPAARNDLPLSCARILERLVRERLLVADRQHGGQATLTVAHESLFRVWDTLREWLRQDRRVLMLRAQIEAAALEGRWNWPDQQIMDAVQEINLSGVDLEHAPHASAVRAFLGPTAREELLRAGGLDAEMDSAAGSGRYGENWRLPLSHDARASVGVRLSLANDGLGDGRRGTGLMSPGVPDIEWCWIDSGETTLYILANADDPSSDVTETMTAAVKPFAIARYPCTFMQFGAFRETRSRLRPDDSEGRRRRVRGGHLNHPVHNVTWDEAMEFCEWLSERTGYLIRLPTEFEWQLAATGGDPDRLFPWGRAWDPVAEPWRANTSESGLGHATAVGMYPHGASPYGVLDMAGTIWEWCLNSFDDPLDVRPPTSPTDRRAARGGSWNTGREHARCTHRYWDVPGDRHVIVGFRVVRIG